MSVCTDYIEKRGGGGGCAQYSQNMHTRWSSKGGAINQNSAYLSLSLPFLIVPQISSTTSPQSDGLISMSRKEAYMYMSTTRGGSGGGKDEKGFISVSLPGLCEGTQR